MASTRRGAWRGEQAREDAGVGGAEGFEVDALAGGRVAAASGGRRRGRSARRRAAAPRPCLRALARQGAQRAAQEAGLALDGCRSAAPLRASSTATLPSGRSSKRRLRCATAAASGARIGGAGQAHAGHADQHHQQHRADGEQRAARHAVALRGGLQRCRARHVHGVAQRPASAGCAVAGVRRRTGPRRARPRHAARPPGRWPADQACVSSRATAAASGTLRSIGSGRARRHGRACGHRCR